MKSKHFEIYELVSKDLYHLKWESAWRYVPEDLITAIDTIKERFPKGTMTINNYFWGGDREWSGLRTPDSKYFSLTSMHSFMRAVDAVFSDYDVEEVRQDIIDNPSIYPTIKGLELGVSWLHIDCRNEDKLITFTS